MKKFAEASLTVITFTPTVNDIGIYTIKITLTDFNVDPLSKEYQVKV